MNLASKIFQIVENIYKTIISNANKANQSTRVNRINSLNELRVNPNDKDANPKINNELIIIQNLRLLIMSFFFANDTEVYFVCISLNDKTYSGYIILCTWIITFVISFVITLWYQFGYINKYKMKQLCDVIFTNPNDILHLIIVSIRNILVVVAIKKRCF